MQFTYDLYHSIINSMRSGVAYHRIIVDEYGNPVDYEFIEVNPAFERITGLVRGNIVGIRATEVLPNIINSQYDWIGEFGKVAIHGESIHLELDFLDLGKYCSVNVYSPSEGYFITIFEDISEFKSSQITLEKKNEELKGLYETIRQMAYFDVLTNLPNRLLFTERLKEALVYSEKNNCKTAVSFVDIDNFKKVNDSLGHFVGDELLKEVGRRLKTCLEGNYTLARFSGDDFTLFIQDINSKDEVIMIANKIKAVFQDPFIIKENNLYLTSSMGISIYPDDGDNIDELLKNADTAMYKAKEHGKNDYWFYNESMKQDIFKKVDLEKRLRHALANDEFTLFFQPQVTAKTGKIRGYEALIRWIDPELGMISPLEFIPVAEEAGLIVPIGEWVLRTACRKKKEWEDLFESDAVISVNISALQFKQRNFVELVKRILDETGLRPEFLELEITESILIESFEVVISMLNELRAMGVKIALDDFGTGYSSLNYLKNLPINSLKIDKAFVHDIKLESVEKAIIGSIISLVHKLELEIIAEGIETKEQLDYLILCNCDSIQGYLLSRPVTEHQAEEFLKRKYFDLSIVEKEKIG